VIGEWVTDTQEQEIVYRSDFVDRRGNHWPEVSIHEVYVDHADLPYDLVVQAKADLRELLWPVSDTP
jgi:hypothetical protein